MYVCVTVYPCICILGIIIAYYAWFTKVLQSRYMTEARQGSPEWRSLGIALLPRTSHS